MHQWQVSDKHSVQFVWEEQDWYDAMLGSRRRKPTKKMDIIDVFIIFPFINRGVGRAGAPPFFFDARVNGKRTQNFTLAISSFKLRVRHVLLCWNEVGARYLEVENGVC